MKFFIYYALVLFCLSSSARAYIPPIGVPDPDWGAMHPIDTVTPSKPESWPGSQEAGFYFVNSASNVATDSSNPFGYPDKPRVTFPRELTAGDVVFIENCRNLASITVAATASSPVWIIGTGAALYQPEQTGTFLHFKGCSYVIVDGINFSGLNCPDDRSSIAMRFNTGCHHVCVRNTTVSNMVVGPYKPDRFQSGGASAWYGAMTSAQAGDDADTHDLVLHNLKLVNNGGGQNLDYETGRHCFVAAARTNENFEIYNVWILDSEFKNNPEDAVQLGRSAGTADNAKCHHFYIGRNTMSNHGENAVDLKACSNIVVSQNIMNGYVATNYREGAVSGSDGSAIVINDDGGGPSNTWWLFNEISDSRCAFRNQSSGGNHYLIGNIIFDLQKSNDEAEPDTLGKNAGVAYWQSASGASTFLIHNTVYGVHGGFYFQNVNNLTVHGNVVMDINDHTEGFPVGVNNLHSNFESQDNFYYDPDGLVIKDTDALSLADVLDFNPELFNPQNGNFMPIHGSPLLKKTSRHYCYDLFEQLYEESILFDFSGMNRPESDEDWTVGAYQMGVNENGFVEPSPPDGLILLP